MAYRAIPGCSGQFWFLQVGINYLPDQDSKTTMLLDLSALMDILPDAIDGFELHPLEETSTLPFLVSNKVKDGFPGLAVLAFQYFLVRDRRNIRGGPSQSTPPLPLSSHRFNDEEDYKPPTAMWGVIRVRANGNIKEACDALAWDMVDSGLTIQWKEHQSSESSAQVLLMNVPPVLERPGVEGEILWHLGNLEKRLMRKGGYSSKYAGVPLPEISVSWRQSRQGKGRSKAERDLSLNLLGQPFQENGCLVCTVEASEGSWKRLGLLWEAFHKTGLCRRALGRSCLMVVMFNGRPTENDRVTMQRLRRVNVMYSYLLSHTHIPNIAVVHKQVEVEMANGSTPPHKFTDLCREFMLLTSSTSAEGKPAYLFDAVIPILSGLRAGSAVVTYRTDNKEAAELINKIKRSVASWFYGYWTQVRKYRPGMVIKLMESFDTEAALITQFSTFDVNTLEVRTMFADEDEYLESMEADLGIKQGWAADDNNFDKSPKITLEEARDALQQTL